jgi:hypothetical protein
MKLVKHELPFYEQKLLIISIYSYLSESAGLDLAAIYACKPTLKAKFCNQLFMKNNLPARQ